MEDPGVDDFELVRRTAAEFVKGMGRRAVNHLFALAVISRDLGDAASERAWMDIADAARRILG